MKQIVFKMTKTPDRKPRHTTNESPQMDQTDARKQKQQKRILRTSKQRWGVGAKCSNSGMQPKD